MPSVLSSYAKSTRSCVCFPFNQQCPILPGSFPPSTVGAKELNYCVRDGNRCSLPAIFTGFSLAFFPLSEKRLRFSLREYPQNQTMYIFLPNHWSSVRPISIGQLNALLHLHLRPINVIVSHGSYHKWRKSILVGGFALRCFQRLSRP